MLNMLTGVELSRPLDHHRPSRFKVPPDMKGRGKSRLVNLSSRFGPGSLHPLPLGLPKAASPSLAIVLPYPSMVLSRILLPSSYPDRHIPLTSPHHPNRPNCDPLLLARLLQSKKEVLVSIRLGPSSAVRLSIANDRSFAFHTP